ncbi:universal stress protein [Streptomyces sp. ME18-1-4]|uniref:universal stress protein n=1 Tax=Streptomyces sp. ME18-1-4 TaxID=3028685 RepID=UPI0029AE98B0|nr:universal stress protein [Streptomyces sp. ME18-1-4]MDX3241366.1 universal stress protein [Streptomyces sp. ME18-1-4]
MSEEVRGLRRPVVAGLDGSKESLAAADWAAREALRRGLTLRLVHAWEGLPDDGAGLPEIRVPQYHAWRVLRAAREQTPWGCAARRLRLARAAHQGYPGRGGAHADPGAGRARTRELLGPWRAKYPRAVVRENLHEGRAPTSSYARRAGPDCRWWVGGGVPRWACTRVRWPTRCSTTSAGRSRWYRTTDGGL